MLFPRKILVHSQLWVALSAAALCQLSLLEWGVKGISPLPLAVGALCWGAYAYIRLIGKATGVHREEYQKWKKILAFGTVFGAVFGLYTLLMLSASILQGVLLLFPAFLLVLFYPLSLKGLGFFRQIPGAKIFVVCGVWLWLTVIIPAILYGTEVLEMAQLTLVHRLVFLFVLTLPFDWRDHKNDPKVMKTIPMVIGIKHSKNLQLILIITLQIAFVLLMFWGEMDWRLGLSYVLGLELLQWLSLRSKIGEDRGLYSFWIEGIPIFVIVCVFFLKIVPA